METNKEKPHLHPKPLLLKLAIPIAVTLTCFFLSTFTNPSPSRRKPPSNTTVEEEAEFMDSPPVSSNDHEEEEVEGPEENTASTCMQRLETTREITLHQTHDVTATSKEIEGLKEIMSALEAKFSDYCNIKEQDSNYQKLQIMCMGLKLEALESENQRLEGTIEELKGVMEQFDATKMEIKCLQRKLKKVSRVSKLYYSRLMHQQETSTIPLVDQLGKIQEQWRADMEEMIYLGWISMCLRHELLGNEGEEKEEAKEEESVRDELVLEPPVDENAKIGTVELCDSKLLVSQKKPRMLHRLKGWAKGKGRCKRDSG